MPNNVLGILLAGPAARSESGGRLRSRAGLVRGQLCEMLNWAMLA
jgi:hypothetical protein